MERYEAKDLEDIARMFDALARDIQRRQQSESGQRATKVSQARLMGERHAYTDCASILRKTTLTGSVVNQDDLGALVTSALDLIPRISEDDPAAPALASWCALARIALKK